MDKENIDKELLDFMLAEYEPNMNCVEAHGDCDHRTVWSDDVCPCQKILMLKKKYEENVE